MTSNNSSQSFFASRRDVLIGAGAAAVALGIPGSGDAAPLKHTQEHPTKGEATVSTFTTKDHAEIWYKDWGSALKEVKRRSAFTALFASNGHPLTNAWTAARDRIEALFSLLESEGCFILRKGTIEAYYLATTGKTPTAGKPMAAAEEVASMRSESGPAVQTRYADVVRCLTKAAKTDVISEAEVFQNFVLSVATPVLANLRIQSSGFDLNTQAKATAVMGTDLLDLREAAGKLVITLKSKVLDVQGFPLTVDAGEDIVSAIQKAPGTTRKP